MSILLSTAYFPPIQYFSQLIHADHVLMERYEHYQKQTYRNRCIIFGANGPLILTVPVTKGKELKIYTKDIKIDYSGNWRKIHLKALESAYKNSPYYEHYIDEFIPVLNKNYNFLYDLNYKILETLCELTGFQLNIQETNEYINVYPENYTDYREILQSKSRDLNFDTPWYQQVFENKHGFQSNLSIVDLLFNTGPDVKDVLLNC